LRYFLNRGEPEQIPEYHRRAAQWYEQHQLVAEAIEHVIAAQEFDWAADLIEQEVQITPRIESSMLLASLEALPQGIVQNRPWLLLSYAWALFSSSQLEAATVALQTVEQLLKQQEQQNSSSVNDKMLWGLVTAFKGMQARDRGDAAESSALIEQALQLLPQNNSWLRATIVLNLGVTYFCADNFEPAAGVLSEATRIGQAQGFADPAIAGLYLQAQFQALRGRMAQATVLCQQGVRLAKERGWLATYAGVLVQVAMGELLREQNQLEAAAQHLTESIERGIQARQPGLMMGYITLARVRQAQGDYKGAWQAIRAAEQCQLWLWPTILSVEACQARLHLMQGNIEAALGWAKTCGLGVEDELRYSFTDRNPQGSELGYLTLARVLIACGRSADVSAPYLDNALRLLIRLQVFAQSGQRNARVMEVLLLQALVWQARSEMEQALRLLEQGLDIPRTGTYVRLFVDEGQPMAELLRHAATRRIHAQFVSRLLADFSPHERETSNTLQPLIEPLSNRELEILRYLTKGLSNQAIANQLFVSLAAVKWHARNIYGKLNANNRTQAVARARELGLLE
jgi:LuxR family maltose regulon positive regulatory protein